MAKVQNIHHLGLGSCRSDSDLGGKTPPRSETQEGSDRLLRSGRAWGSNRRKAWQYLVERLALAA
ncbi:MAG: hypothetical protein JXP73_13670 [Deltaproteobacteria bacterium]|nr:hypothetical protein [Deltaproteobacteria bacterium]